MPKGDVLPDPRDARTLPASSTVTAEALLYTLLWASASIATKFGLRAGPPLMLAVFRFTFAGVALVGLQIALGQGVHLPRRWLGPVFLLGLLNTTIYLGASYLALNVVPVGLFNLFVAVNPLLVLLVERLALHRPVAGTKWIGLGLAGAGLTVGAWTSIAAFRTPLFGLGLILLGQAAMAIGSVYFQMSQIDLSPLRVNTYQLIWGAALLWPLALLTEHAAPIHWNAAWWGSVAWLAGAVSIGAMLLWFHLLRQGGASRASFWLLLTPILGYGLAWALLGEPVTGPDAVAAALVIAGLLTAQGKSRPPSACQGTESSAMPLERTT